jgi:hypothetical protein
MGHMLIQTFLLRMTDTTTSQNIDLSSHNTLYNFMRISFDKQINNKLHSREDKGALYYHQDTSSLKNKP